MIKIKKGTYPVPLKLTKYYLTTNGSGLAEPLDGATM
jgi:hypothetical protein